jgi:8-oxo-dGTP diphosphatase
MTEPQRIGACAILVNPEGKILAGKRKNSYKAGYYGLPGGRIELNEPIEEAVRREVLEEVGIKIKNLQYVGVVRDNQGEYDFIHFIFVATEVKEKPQLCEPEKCEGWEWLDASVFEKDLKMLFGHQAAIEMYLANEGLRDLTT